MQLRPTQSILPREQVPRYAAKPFPTQFHKIVKPICLNPGACNRHIGSGRDERCQRWKRRTARPGVEDAKRPESRIRQQREESPVRAAQSVCIAPLGLHLNPSPTRGSGARYRGRPSPPAILLRAFGAGKSDGTPGNRTVTAPRGDITTNRICRDSGSRFHTHSFMDRLPKKLPGQIHESCRQPAPLLQGSVLSVT